MQFFSSDKRLQENFFFSPSRVKWSAPKMSDIMPLYKLYHKKIVVIVKRGSPKSLLAHKKKARK